MDEDALCGETPFSGRVHGGQELCHAAGHLSNSDAAGIQRVPHSGSCRHRALRRGAEAFREAMFWVPTNVIAKQAEHEQKKQFVKEAARDV